MIVFGLQTISHRKHESYRLGKVCGKVHPLKGIQFPNPGIRPIVDLLIGNDYAELHYSFKDVRGLFPDL